MKQIVKRYVPASWIAVARRLEGRLVIRSEFRKDRRRFAAHAAPADGAATPKVRARNLEAQVTKDYHRVEKGLALREPRRPFGAAVARRLDLLVPAAAGSNYSEYALSAHAALSEWNEHGVVSDEVSPARRVERGSFSEYEQFFSSRHSVRDFDGQPVENSVFERAVELAINSPSVCNRQAWRVRVYSGFDAVGNVLSFQNGNTGFADVPSVALVTVDTRLFTGVEERNQGWIEGGIFSMSLVWALHAMNVDTCMLNMSVRNKRTDAMRAALGLDDSELVIMMIAAGYGRPGHRVARSPHRAVRDVLSLE